MDWGRARRILHLPDGGAALLPQVPESAAGVRRGASLCVASGKGGTGKSVVGASLATLFARTGRTLIVDADLGVGNAHILQDVTPDTSFAEVVDGKLGVRDIRVECRPNLDLLGGGSGVSRMAGLSTWELHLLARGIEAVETEYETLVLDSAAGISVQTVGFAAASDVVLIVTTPDITALTDAYAFLKALLLRRGECDPVFVVNRAASAAEARHVADRLCAVSAKFLGRVPRFFGFLPEDRAVARSVNARVPVALSEPGSAIAQALEHLAAALSVELARQPARGLGRTLLRSVGRPSDGA